MMHRDFKIILIPTALVAALGIMIFVAANSSLKSFAQRIILSESELHARHWADNFVRAVPDLQMSSENGQISDKQRAMIQDAKSIIGDVFRFKLFDMKGRLVYVSDEDVFINETDEGNIDALQVIETMAPIVYIKDGHNVPSRPDDYVEAYVPAQTLDGEVFGIIEVYVDVSDMTHNLHKHFQDLTLSIFGACMFLFLGPSAVLFYRTYQLRRKDQKLLELSRFDSLTHVLNRGAFTSAIRTAFSVRHSSKVSIGVFYVDLDRFKEVNDELGHSVGDALLRHVSEVLARSVRDSDTVGRIGGDEFVIFMPDIYREELLAIGERIQTALKLPFQYGDTEIPISISIGAHLSEPGENHIDAMNAADVAVYEAKANGRGCLVEYTEKLAHALRRKKFVNQAVSTGLSRQGFFLQYQPIFEDRGTTLLGFEALLRLKAMDGTLIPPSEFIPIAERTGLIGDIGAWTLRQAMLEAARWPNCYFVSVNLSAEQFKSGQLCPSIESALNESGLDPKRLELELTESLLIEDEDLVGRQLACLKGAGIRTALDDFGTGYSSLGYLWKFEFDKLKVDRVFVEALQYNAKKYRKILATILVLGKELNMDVTVEGIETEEQLRAVCDLGAVQVQGYLLGKPLTAPVARDLANSGISKRRKQS